MSQLFEISSILLIGIEGTNASRSDKNDKLLTDHMNAEMNRIIGICENFGGILERHPKDGNWSKANDSGERDGVAGMWGTVCV